MMGVSVRAERTALEAMTVAQLRTRYALVFDEPASSRHRDHLIRRILWRLQALDEGGLSERARRRAAAAIAIPDLPYWSHAILAFTGLPTVRCCADSELIRFRDY